MARDQVRRAVAIPGLRHLRSSTALVKAPAVTSHLLRGDLVIQLEADANQMLARDLIDMTLMKLKLAQMPYKSEPSPYEGSCS